MPAKVLFVALDACDVEVATRLAGDGRMPVLAELLATAQHVPTVAPPAGTYVSGVWPTIVTGVSPVRHGYTCWKTIDATTGEERPTSPKDVAFDPFWMRLSDEGRHVALLDVPHTWPAPDFNGVMLCEFGAHDRHFGLASWPPDAAPNFAARFGAPRVATFDRDMTRQFAPCDFVHGGPWGLRTLEQARALRDDLFDGIEVKKAVSLDVLAGDDWDLFGVVLGESHCGGHQFWYLHDPDHDRFDTAHAAALGDPVTEIYARLDAVLGAHLDAVDDATDVVVLLSHGMGAHYNGAHLLEPVLERLAVADSDAGRSRGAVRAVKRAWSALPTAMRRRLHPLVARAARRRVGEAEPAYVTSFARSERPYFSFPNNDPVGAVRINLIGRDPDGIVAPQDYERVRATLTSDLLDLVNLDTGRPAVSRVQRGDELFGTTTGSFADLYLDWDWSHPTERVYSPKLGALDVSYTHVRSGDHQPHGLLLARGPSVTAGPPAPPVILESVAPTLAALLGVELADVDGEPITAITGGRVGVRP